MFDIWKSFCNVTVFVVTIVLKVYKIKVNKYYIVATGKDFAKASK